MKALTVKTREDEQARLVECAKEEIRMPGSIQPHGVMLAAHPQTGVIEQVSSNTEERWGMAPGELLGRSLAQVLGAEVSREIAAVLSDDSIAVNPVRARVAEAPWELIVHDAGELLVVEAERADSEDIAGASAIYAQIHRLAAESTIPLLFASVARVMRQLTGFDRVLVYQFHADGHGEVVAEDAHSDMERHMGLHFPASDIPPQARELYLSKMSRSIVLGEDAPVSLEPAVNPRTGAPMNMAQAELRAVSPHHIQFMRNLGQESTMSLSLVHQGTLIGMITCAHRTPRVVPYVRRQGYEVMARQVVSQWATLREIERATHLEHMRRVRTQLAQGLPTNDDISQTLMKSDTSVTDMIAADGTVLYLDGRATTAGTVPGTRVLDQLLSSVGAQGGDDIVASDSLVQDFPHLASQAPEMAGVLVVPFGSESNYVAWWRRETVQTVQWMGDQTSANRATPFSPRHSFESWTETVKDTCVPWEELARLEARELRADLNAALLRRAESQLAQLALHDALTGLPNRRLLFEVLERGMARRYPPARIAALFIDLDGFKEINDHYGHGHGDELIMDVAVRLRRVIRGGDTVARIGGDEFVVASEVADDAEARATAKRILDEFREPTQVLGQTHLVTLSIGIAVATTGATPDSLLSAADAAMYRAKNAGKNQISE